MEDEGDDLSIPQMKKSFRRDINLETEMEKVETPNDDDEEPQEEEDYENIPFQKIGEFLIYHFRKNKENKIETVVYEEKETGKKYSIHVRKFYNTLSEDQPVKVKIGKKNFVFKQVSSMFPDYYCMNVYRVLNENWAKHNINARIPVYGIHPLAMSLEIDGDEKKREFVFGGFIEFIEGNTMMNVTDKDLLKIVLNSKKTERETVLDSFLSSFVGTTVGNFFCGLQDRHQYNVILTKDCKICHIDLNSVFGEGTPFHERLGLISAPSLYFPQSCRDFLKNSSIDKIETFKDDVKKAFECLPPFEKIQKVLGHEKQMKFVHDRMYGFTSSWLLENLLNPTNLIHKNIRDIFQKEVFGLGPSSLNLAAEESFHIIAKRIYRVNSRGLFSMENTENWGNVLPVYCFGEENEVFLVSYLSGSIYLYNTKEKSFRSVSQWNWKSTKGMIYYDGYLYVVCDKFYKVNVSDGFYKVISDQKWATQIHQGAVLKEKLYLFQKGDSLMYIFDPKSIEVSRQRVGGVKKFPISKKVIASEDHQCIYFIEPYLFCLGLEDGMKELQKVSDLEFKGVLAAVTHRNELIIVKGSDLLLWDREKDKEKKINIGNKSWNYTTLAF